MESLEHYIAPLLEQHDCVMVPDLGGFLLNYMPAGFSVMHEMCPPAKTVSFNKNLNVNDGLLAQFIAQTENITYSEALLKIKGEVDKMKYFLREGESLVLIGIGTLTQNEEQKLLFSPDNTRNYLIDSYGLPNLALSPIEKGEPSKIYRLQNEKQQNPSGKPLKLNMAASFSIAASLLLAFLVYFKNTQIDPIQVSQVVRAKHQRNMEIKAAPNLASTFYIPKLNVDIFDGETKNIEPASKTKFYVVGGCFKKETNADILVAQLKEKGYNPNILNTKNGLYRVTYIEEADSLKADADLRKIKISENQGAWLLKWQ